MLSMILTAMSKSTSQVGSGMMIMAIATSIRVATMRSVRPDRKMSARASLSTMITPVHDVRARAAIPPTGRVPASCRGILKTAHAQNLALLDLFTQHGACQAIEFLALLELRQDRGQQLLEDRNRAVSGQDLGIGDDRLDE